MLYLMHKLGNEFSDRDKKVFFSAIFALLAIGIIWLVMFVSTWGPQSSWAAINIIFWTILKVLVFFLVIFIILKLILNDIGLGKPKSYKKFFTALVIAIILTGVFALYALPAFPEARKSLNYVSAESLNTPLKTLLEKNYSYNIQITSDPKIRPKISIIDYKLREIDKDLMVKFPEDLWARSPEEVNTIIFTRKTTEPTGAMSMFQKSGGPSVGSITVYRQVVRLTIIDTSIPAIVNETVFVGSGPPGIQIGPGFQDTGSIPYNDAAWFISRALKRGTS